MASGSGGGGSNITGAQIVDASVGLADLAANAQPGYYINTVKSSYPRPVWNDDSSLGDATFDVAQGLDTNLKTSVLNVPQPITVNAISIYSVSVSTPGTVKLVVYSEDGQTQLIAVTTATISAGGVITTAVPGGVLLAAGNYYFGILAVNTAALTVASWQLTNRNESTMFTTGTSGKPVLVGKSTVTANTLPATISPTSLTADTDIPEFRLDN